MTSGVSRVSAGVACAAGRRGSGVASWARPSTAALAAAAVCLVSPTRALAQTSMTFGNEQVYDVNQGLDTLGLELYREWDTGDDLLLNLSAAASEGGFTGKRNQVIIPEVKVFGQTVVPEVTADTRRGATIDASLDVTTGMILGAYMDFTGAGINGTLGILPELTYEQSVIPGRRYALTGSNTINPTSSFQGGLPEVGVFTDFVLDARLQMDVAARIPGVLPFTSDSVVADTGYTRTRLLELGVDLAAAGAGDVPSNLYDLAFPSDPVFQGTDEQIAQDLASDPDDSLFRFKLPQDPAFSFGEIQLVNPGPGLTTGTTTIADNTVSYTTRGDFLRLGADIDGIASALNGLPPFLGTEIPIGEPTSPWAKIKYDLIDVKYGPELSYQTRTEVTPALNVTLNFDQEILIDQGGLLQTATSWTGDWTELPDFALISRDDVNVDVDFTELVLNGVFANDLVLSDYFEIRGGQIEFKLQAGIVPIPIAKFGPLLYNKLDPLGEGIAFEIFAEAFEIGRYDMGDAFDGSFTLEAAELMEAYLLNEGSSLNAADFALFGSTTPLTTLAGKTLVLGVRDFSSDAPETRLDPNLAPANFFDETGGATTIDGLVLLQDSVYFLDGANRTFKLSFIENHGELTNNQGNLAFRNTGGVLNIFGNGFTNFVDATTFTADLIVHGQGHALDFANFSESPSHSLQAEIIDNAGRISASGDARVTLIADTQFDNADTGHVEAQFGGRVVIQANGPSGINNPSLLNAGLIEADGAGSSVLIESRGIRGSDDLQNPGRFNANDGGVIDITHQGESMYFTGATHFIAETDSTINLNRQVFVLGDVVLETQAGGTMSLNGMGLDFQFDDITPRIQIVNRGTLDILADNSLLPPTPGSQAPSISPAVTPIDLLNEGTINVRNDADFEFNVRIDNYADGGAVFAGGTWNVFGDAGPFSNLITSFNPDTVTSISINVAEVEQDGVIYDLVNDLNDGFDDAFDSPPDTFLKTNEANVTLHGRASFQYFNTVEVNRGDFTVSGGHQFTTAGRYVNEGGTTTVENDNSRLDVAGPLFVRGGVVTIGRGAGFSVQTGQITLDDDTLADRTVEVIGGTFNLVADADNALDSTSMFFDRASADSRFIGLNAGQTWIVREGVDIDPLTGDETVTPAAINLVRYSEIVQVIDQPSPLPDLTIVFPRFDDYIIERNNGSIVIDGENASFDAAEGMQYNHGRLTLANGFEFNTRVNDFRNAPEATLILEGASFIVENDELYWPDGGEFRNDGLLVMDVDSYLRADHFINGKNSSTAYVQLNGVIDAPLVTITAGTTIAGSGSITGAIENFGTLDLGNSPGLITAFGDYTQADSATATFEIDGYDPATAYDQLVVQRLDPLDGEPAQPDPVVSLDGLLELVFADSLNPRPGFHWRLIDNQGSQPILGAFADILVTGLTDGEPLDTDGLDTTGDTYLGHLGNFGLFLTYQGGTGNDLVVYTIPEPASLAALAAMFVLTHARRRTA